MAFAAAVSMDQNARRQLVEAAIADMRAAPWIPGAGEAPGMVADLGDVLRAAVDYHAAFRRGGPRTIARSRLVAAVGRLLDEVAP